MLELINSSEGLMKMGVNMVGIISRWSTSKMHSSQNKVIDQDK